MEDKNKLVDAGDGSQLFFFFFLLGPSQVSKTLIYNCAERERGKNNYDGEMEYNERWKEVGIIWINYWKRTLDANSRIEEHGNRLNISTEIIY